MQAEAWLVPSIDLELAQTSLALGSAGISIESGGNKVINGVGVGHYLFASDAPVVDVLRQHGIEVVAERETIMLRLDQETPGQLGKAIRLMAVAGVNIVAQYSDHDNQLVLVVDDMTVARAASSSWAPHVRGI